MSSKQIISLKYLISLLLLSVNQTDSIFINDEGNHPAVANDICNQGAQFDSIFMLGHDTFFKIEKKIWVQTATKNSKPLLVNEIEDLWKITNRLEYIEDSIENYTEIDLSEQIFAFDYHMLYKELCDSANDTEWCYKHAVNGLASYVCFYGMKKTNNVTDKVVAAMTYYDVSLFPIEEPAIHKVVLDFCKRQPSFLHTQLELFVCNSSHPMTGWSDYQPYRVDGSDHALTNFYLCHNIDGPYRNTDVLFSLRFKYSGPTNTDLLAPEWEYGKEPRLIHNHLFNNDVDKNKTGIIFPLRFKDDVTIVLNCKPNKCGLFDVLDVNTFADQNLKGPNRGQTFTLSDTLSISKILRCPNAIEYQSTTFDPNYFCGQRSFDSIFSLGDDIYFQSNGKFWRYYALGSTTDSLPLITEKIMNIRFDSYTTTLLRKYFDLNKKVVGFTLRKPYICDEYSTSDLNYMNCNIKRRIRHYFRLTCLYGYDKNSGNLTAYGFMNSPAGIEVYHERGFPFPEIHDQRCEEILPDFFWDKSYKNIKLESIAAIDAEFNETALSMNHTILICYKENDDTIYPKLYVYIKQNYQDDGLPRQQLLYDQVSSALNKYKILFYYKPWSKWIAIDEVSKHYKIHINSTLNRGNGHSFEPIPEHLNGLMNCTAGSNPTAMSYSLVSIENTFDWMCGPTLHEGVEMSVFNIGEYVYIQTNKRFHRFYRLRLIYDKQVSELLNDIFDTNERVIGFSYLYRTNFADTSDNTTTENGKIYRIVLMGKPNWIYSKTFNQSVVYRVFEKKTGPFAPLIPIRELVYRIQMDWMPTNSSFGGVDNHCNESDHEYKCLPGVSMAKQSDQLHLTAMAYLQMSSSHSDANLNEKDQSLSPVFLSTILDTTTLYSTDDIRHVFWKPLLTQGHSVAGLEEDFPEFDKEEWHNRSSIKVYGMFSFWGIIYLVGSGLDPSDNRNANSVTKVYRASVIDYANQHMPYPFNWSKILHPTNRISSVYEFFKCGTELASSSDSSPLVLLPMFILILILIIIVVLIGLLAYKRYSSIEEKTKSRKEKNKLDSVLNKKSSIDGQKSSEV